MQSIRSARLIVVVTIAFFVASSCSEPSRAVANDLLRRTDPAPATVGALSGPTRTEGSVLYTWDIEVTQTPAEYSMWIRKQFADFEIVAATPDTIRLARLMGGDAYRLVLNMEVRRGRTYVNARLTISPD